MPHTCTQAMWQAKGLYRPGCAVFLGGNKTPVRAGILEPTLKQPWMGSNHRIWQSKCHALPLGNRAINNRKAGIRTLIDGFGDHHALQLHHRPMCSSLIGMFQFHHHYVPTGVLSRQPFRALSFSVRRSAYSHIIRE